MVTDKQEENHISKPTLPNNLPGSACTLKWLHTWSCRAEGTAIRQSPYKTKSWHTAKGRVGDYYPLAEHQVASIYCRFYISRGPGWAKLIINFAITIFLHWSHLAACDKRNTTPMPTFYCEPATTLLIDVATWSMLFVLRPAMLARPFLVI